MTARTNNPIEKNLRRKLAAEAGLTVCDCGKPSTHYASGGPRCDRCKRIEARMATDFLPPTNYVGSGHGGRRSASGREVAA